jgi:hypothetical protein
LLAGRQRLNQCIICWLVEECHRQAPAVVLFVHRRVRHPVQCAAPYGVGPASHQATQVHQQSSYVDIHRQHTPYISYLAEEAAEGVAHTCSCRQAGTILCCNAARPAEVNMNCSAHSLIQVCHPDLAALPAGLLLLLLLRFIRCLQYPHLLAPVAPATPAVC